MHHIIILNSKSWVLKAVVTPCVYLFFMANGYTLLAACGALYTLQLVT